MINTQNIAELSERVAALEAAIKEAGIELPSVTTDDNGKTLQVVSGKWDKGVTIPSMSASDEGKVFKINSAGSIAYGKIETDEVYDGETLLSTILEAKAPIEDLGAITATDVAVAMGLVWDDIQNTGTPVLVRFSYSGAYVGLAYKYPNGQYGMMIAFNYNTARLIMLNVDNTVKTVKYANFS